MYSKSRYRAKLPEVFRVAVCVDSVDVRLRLNVVLVEVAVVEVVVVLVHSRLKAIGSSVQIHGSTVHSRSEAAVMGIKRATLTTALAELPSGWQEKCSTKCG